MTVAFVVPDLSMGGAQRSLVKLANVLARHGRATAVICIGGADAAMLNELDPGVRVMYLGLRRSADPRLLLRLRHTLRRLAPDTVVGWSLYANFAALLAGRLAGVPHLVISERNYLPELLGSGEDSATRRRVLRLLVRHLYPMASVVTANSRQSLRFLERYLRAPSRTRFEWLPNLAETDRFEALCAEALPPRVVAPRCGPRLVGVGRLHSQKGFDLLLRALAALPPGMPWELNLAGDGPEGPALQALTDELGLADRVHFLGRVDNPFPLYRWADLVVVPSRFEGFPNVPLEAMSVGAAVIVANCRTGPHELTEGGRFARLVPVGDVAALAAAMAELGSRPLEAKRLGDAARAHVERNYGRDHVEASYMALLGAAPR